jgi:hypothetical protein
VRGRDQGLAGNAVGQDGGAAQSVPVHDGDGCAKVGGDKRRLIPARTTTEDDD